MAATLKNRSIVLLSMEYLGGWEAGKVPFSEQAAC